MSRPRSWMRAAVILAGVAAFSGCATPELGAPETFRWAQQPIEFRPPPGGWRREGDMSGGRRGIYFVKERSVGEAISVGEYYPVGDRDRRAELVELARRVPALDDWGLRRALSIARWRTDQTYSASEAATAASVNADLDRAMDALIHGDRAGVESGVRAAAIDAESLSLTLEDVLPEVEFRPERRNQPSRYRVTHRGAITIAGHPAVRIDFEVRTDGGLRRCSEVYVMHRNHLFIAGYIGLPSHLPLYDRVVASIVFPSVRQAGS